MIVPMYALRCDGGSCDEWLEPRTTRGELHAAARTAGWRWSAFAGWLCPLPHPEQPRERDR